MVAYAYLRDGDALVGDVWLYNVGADPASVDWHDPALMPFCNPAAYCGDAPLPRLRDDAVVKCRWSERGALVVIDGVPWALLERDAAMKALLEEAAEIEADMLKINRAVAVLPKPDYSPYTEVEEPLSASGKIKILKREGK